MNLHTVILGCVCGALAAGCSVTTYSYDECSTNAECHEAFGWGTACTGGLCQRVAQSARCDRTYPNDLFEAAAPWNDTLVIGTLMDRAVPKKIARENSARLAVVQVNDEGGLQGRDVAMVMCTIEENSAYDDLSQEEAAVAAGLYLADELGVVAIVGPSGSGNTSNVFAAVKDLGTLVISPSATSPALTLEDVTDPTEENPGLLWRTAPPDGLQGSLISDDMDNVITPAVQRVYVIYADDSYGTGLAGVFTEEFPGMFKIIAFANETEQVAAVNAAVTDAAFVPDQILFISSETADILSFLSLAATLPGYAGKGIFLTDSARSSELLEATATLDQIYTQIRGSAPAASDPTLAQLAFWDSYNREYGEDVSIHSYTSQSFDASWLTIYGMAAAKFVDGDITGIGTARGLRHVSGGLELDIVPTSWNTVLQSFGQGMGIDVTGASGDLDYQLDTEELSAPIEIWTIAQGGGGTYTFVTEYIETP